MADFIIQRYNENYNEWRIAATIIRHDISYEEHIKSIKKHAHDPSGKYRVIRREETVVYLED